MNEDHSLHMVHTLSPVVHVENPRHWVPYPGRRVNTMNFIKTCIQPPLSRKGKPHVDWRPTRITQHPNGVVTLAPPHSKLSSSKHSSGTISAVPAPAVSCHLSALPKARKRAPTRPTPHESDPVSPSSYSASAYSRTNRTMNRRHRLLVPIPLPRT
jgi:hypothetical protein